MSIRSFFLSSIILTIVVLILKIISVQADVNKPAWLDLKYNPKDVYYGIGCQKFYDSEPSVEVIKKAQSYALENLCLKLSAIVISEMRDIISEKNKNGRSISEEDVSSSLFVKTKQTLKGWKVKDTWTSIENKLYWNLVVIDKKEADNQVREQRFYNEVVDGLKDEIRNVLKKQRELAKKLEAEMEEHLKKILEEIKDNKREKIYDINEIELLEPDSSGSTGLPEPVKLQ